MYCKHERTALVTNHASVLGGTDGLRDSQLLQAYATFSALRKLDPDPEKAYQQMIDQYSTYSKALRKDFRPPFNDAFIHAISNVCNTQKQLFRYVSHYPESLQKPVADYCKTLFGRLREYLREE